MAGSDDGPFDVTYWLPPDCNGCAIELPGRRSGSNPPDGVVGDPVDVGDSVCPFSSLTVGFKNMNQELISCRYSRFHTVSIRERERERERERGVNV